MCHNRGIIATKSRKGGEEAVSERNWKRHKKNFCNANVLKRLIKASPTLSIQTNDLAMEEGWEEVEWRLEGWKVEEWMSGGMISEEGVKWMGEERME